MIMKKIASEENLADIMTKGFKEQDFERKRWQLGLRLEEESDEV